MRRKRMFFKAAHRDKAERPIIDALKAAGASVYPISSKDIPDLLVGYRGQTFLLEVKSRLTNTKKDGYTRKTTTKVSEGQQAFMDTWKGGPVRVVHTPEEALHAIGAPVEGVLEPLKPIPVLSAEAHRAYVRDVLEPEMHRLMSPSPGHVVTHAYQREQTEAVVPKRRKPTPPPSVPPLKKAADACRNVDKTSGDFTPRKGDS